MIPAGGPHCGTIIHQAEHVTGHYGAVTLEDIPPLKFKSRQISFVYKIHDSCQIVLTFYTEHGSNTAVLCAKLQNDLTTEE